MVGREEFMDIHELWVRGKNISQIARLTDGDRKTVRRLLAVGQQPRKPRQVASKLDPFREYILARMLADGDPVSNAEVIYDEICARGYTSNRCILKEFSELARLSDQQLEDLARDVAF